MANAKTQIFTILIALLIPAIGLGEDWLQFRGPGGTSAVSNQKVPTEFNDTKNIGWKTDLPAKGASSPIVVGDNVIVTCSGGNQQEQLYTVCLDTNDGKMKWTQK